MCSSKQPVETINKRFFKSLSILLRLLLNQISNAKRLDETNQGKPPSKAAPGTKVYELVERLKPYLPEE